MPTAELKVKGLGPLVGELAAAETLAPTLAETVPALIADAVAAGAKRRVPKRSGRAASTVRASRSAMGAAVTGGGPTAPYYGWLDYGGKVGRRRSVSRPYRSEGRYIYAAYRSEGPQITPLMEREVGRMLDRAGLDHG